MTRRTAARAAALAVLIAALTLTAYLLPLRRLATQAGQLGPVAAIGLGAVLLLALVPRTVVSLACGAFFGAWHGAGYAIAAAMAGAAIAFGLGRLLGRGAVATAISRPVPAAAEPPGWLRRAPRRLARLDGWLRRQGTLAVIVLRMFPAAPFGLVSYAYGASGTRTRHYLLGTFIAATPSAITYAIVGSAATAPGAFAPITLAPAALGLAVTGAAALWWRRRPAGAAPAES